MMMDTSFWDTTLGSNTKTCGRKHEDVILGLELLGNKLPFSEGQSNTSLFNNPLEVHSTFNINSYRSQSI